MLRASADGYEVDDDPGRLDLDVVVSFLQTTYWAAHRSREAIERSITSSTVAGLYAPDTAQVGFARVVSDKATFAYLADVFVLPGHRGRGLARLMVQTMLDHPDLADVELWTLRTADAHGVYAPLGFGAINDPSRFMIRSTRPDVAVHATAERAALETPR